MNKEIGSMRIEVSFKSTQQLRKLLKFYVSKGEKNINIPCKGALNGNLLREALALTRTEFPQINLVPHFSVNYEFVKNREATIGNLLRFVNTCADLGIKEILLVSGGKKRKQLDSVDALRVLKKNEKNLGDVTFGVAFNPYVPQKEMEKERARLVEKLQTGIVTSIWLQYGTDLDRLANEIPLLRKYEAKIYGIACL